MVKKKTMVVLRAMFRDIKGIKDARDFDGSDGIHLGNCAEGGTIDGVAACDYYADDPEEGTYIMGVHKKLYKALSDMGWHAECYDPVTYIAYQS